MHIKVPFLTVLILSIVQLSIYGIQHNKYSTTDLESVLTVEINAVEKVRWIDSDGLNHDITDEKQIDELMDFLNHVAYKRLRNDQTSYMPSDTTMIYLYTNEATDFLIPYEKEAFINHKVYKIKHGYLSDEALLDILREP